ncbi:MAG TPA: EamA family transporter [Oscillospiraceae bacterium]|nr:EamA family transporter [Oscillospiraceae bacterium]
MWILFAFAAAFFAGITAILAKCGIKDIDSNVATAIRAIIILVFSWLIVFIVDSQSTITNISGKTLLFLILSGLATGASWICYFKALQLGDVNKVAPIDKFSTVLSILLAFIIFGEPVTILKAVAILPIAIGTYLMIQKKQVEKHAASSNKKWIVYAFLSALFASLTSILGKIGISGVESNLGTAIRTVVVLVMAWVVVFITGKQGTIRKIGRRSLLFICLSGVATGASWLCYYRALQEGQASIVVPIDQLSIVLTVSFSYFILKEKVTKKSLAGLSLLVAGTMALIIK